MRKFETVGVSPKAVAAAVAAVVAYLLGQEVLELSPLAKLVLNVVLVGLAAAAAGPGHVRQAAGRRGGEAGYTLIELVVGAILLLVFLYVLFALLPLDHRR